MKDLFGVRHETLSTMVGRHIVGADRVDRRGDAYANDVYLGNVFTPANGRKRLPGEVPGNSTPTAVNTIVIFFLAALALAALTAILGNLGT